MTVPTTPMDHQAHRASEQFAEEAARLSHLSKDCYKTAAKLEEQAALACDPALDQWVALLAHSAACLFLKAGEPAEAARVVQYFLQERELSDGWRVSLSRLVK